MHWFAAWSDATAPYAARLGSRARLLTPLLPQQWPSCLLWVGAAFLYCPGKIKSTEMKTHFSLPAYAPPSTAFCCCQLEINKSAGSHSQGPDIMVWLRKRGLMSSTVRRRRLLVGHRRSCPWSRERGVPAGATALLQVQVCWEHPWKKGRRWEEGRKDGLSPSACRPATCLLLTSAQTNKEEALPVL